MLKRSIAKRSADKKINGQKDQWAKRSIVNGSIVKRSTVQKDQLNKRSIVEKRKKNLLTSMDTYKLRNFILGI